MESTSERSSPRRIAALASGTLLNLTFGSLYAWSVFVVGLEMEFGIYRTEVSLVFAAAIVSFTVGNIVSPFLFGRVPAAVLPIIATGTAGFGLSLASNGESYADVMIGYGGLFGFACGFAYNAALQFAQNGLPSKKGLANGIVISAFAIGGMIAAYLLSASIESVGIQTTFWRLALVVGTLGTTAAVLTLISGVTLSRQSQGIPEKDERHFIGICWIGLFLGAFAGVMAIGHAAAVIEYFGGGIGAAAFGVTLLGLANAFGRLIAGWLCDHVSIRTIAAVAHLTGAIAFMVVLANPTSVGAVISMGLAGLAYGLASGVYPTAIALHLGQASYGRNFAILLTSWGIAGLTGPWVGGVFFDMTSDYRISLEMAIVACLCGIFNAMRLPRERAGATIKT